MGSGAPGQRVEPRLADHIQVCGDVCRSVLTARKRSGHYTDFIPRKQTFITASRDAEWDLMSSADMEL